MKIKQYIFLTLLTLSFGLNSCYKGAFDPGCDAGKYGYITIINTSSDPYDFYIDDQLQMTIAGNTNASNIHIKAGDDRKLYVKQANGFLVSPTEETKFIDVKQCKYYNWQIP
jgi:hypothetical protein